MKKLFSISILAAIVIAACTKENYENDHPKVKVIPPPTNPNTPAAIDTCKDSVKYSVHIKRIMKNDCAISGCHDGISKSNFNDYNTVLGDTAGIIDRMNNSSNPMPPTGLLDACKIGKVKAWVKAGAKNN
jgi:PBP1b-binding outer membrane lipoprotein LpoB